MRQKILSKIGNCVRVIEVRDIVRFAAEDKYIVAHTGQDSVVFEGVLSELEAEFAVDFVRIHRGHLVRRSHLVDFRWDGYQASVGLRESLHRVPVARSRHRQVRSLIEAPAAAAPSVRPSEIPPLDSHCVSGTEAELLQLLHLYGCFW